MKKTSGHKRATPTSEASQGTGANPQTRRVIVCMFKGGTGKSTVATNVSVGLARRGRRVALVDLDAQGNTTDMLGHADHGTSGMYGVIVEGAKPQDIAIEVEEGLTLFPSSRALAPIDAWLAMQMRREQILEKRFASLSGYDYVILDTGPAFSLLNLNALCYATEAWVPVAMEYLSLSGMAQVQETLRMVQEELGHRLPMRCVIPTFFDRRTSKAKAVMEALEGSFKQALTPPIHANVRLSEAPSYHQNIFDYAPRSTGAEDFQQLVEHIEKEI